MIDVVQYPHTLTAKIIGPGTKDAMGNPIPGTETSRVQKCRAEAPNVKTEPIKNNDGESLAFSWIVYMPFGVAKLAEGTEVSITDKDGSLFCTGTVKRFYNGQLNTRLWL
jgi:hypothetical protein